MQYLLTQQEYDQLRARQQHDIKVSREHLQSLCTKIADEMPVPVKNSSEADATRPWGCILTVKTKYDHYCDRCPVNSICPYDHKEWSK